MSRVFHYFPPVFWMAAIFLFSTSMFGNESTASVFEAAVRFFYPDVSSGSLEAAHFIVRKSAHFAEYAVLAALWYGVIARHDGCPPARAAMYAVTISILYAATDEYHQSFVHNRGPKLTDVIIDSAGAATAAAMMYYRHKKTHP